MNEKEFQKAINWKPHKTQKEVLRALNKGLREIVIAAGKGWGKSALCGYVIARTFINYYEELLKGKRDSIKIWVVAPTYDLSDKVFTYVVEFLRRAEPKIMNFLRNRPFPQIELSKNVWIQCKSAENPKSLIGERLDLLVVDEAAFIPPSIWYDNLLPTTASKTKKGVTIFISTPQGKNWFYELYLKAKEKGGAFHFTSLDGVEIDEKEWERLKEICPKDLFAQNYEAVFLEDAVSVFRGVDEIIRPNILREPEPGRSYVGGLDLAQVRDFTVLTIFDKFSHEQVYFDRFQKIPYTLQLERIENAAKKYNATLIVEINNVGLAIADELKARGVKVEDFKTTGTVSKDFNKKGTKEQLIEKLSLDIENKNIFLAPIEVQINELKAFTYIYTPSRNISYGAPEGYHDDCVMAIALANWGLRGKTREERIREKLKEPVRKRKFQYF